MSDALMQMYDTMTETEQKELYDFAQLIMSKREMQEKKAALEELHSVFGAMTHEEAEEIRNNRLTIRERF